MAGEDNNAPPDADAGGAEPTYEVVDAEGKPILDENGQPRRMTAAEIEQNQLLAQIAQMGISHQTAEQQARLQTTDSQTAESILRAIISQRIPQMARMYEAAATGHPARATHPYWGVHLKCPRMLGRQEVTVYLPKDYGQIHTMQDLLSWLFVYALTLTPGPHAHAHLSDVEIHLFETEKPPPTAGLQPPPKPKLIV